VLSLMVFKNGNIVESSELAWEDSSCEKIIPKRDPDKKVGEMRYWWLAFDRRAAFCRYANKMLDKYGTNKESVFGFFGIAGLAEKYLKDRSVEWCVTYQRHAKMQVERKAG